MTMTPDRSDSTAPDPDSTESDPDAVPESGPVSPDGRVQKLPDDPSIERPPGDGVPMQ
jgi:hypothetical protein